MSDAVFPYLPGLSWGVVKTPIWSTGIQTTVSGRESRVARFSYPVYQFKLTYEFLRSGNGRAELQTLLGFFNARNGSFDTFLYRDPEDNTATREHLGFGDGFTKDFPLIRAYGGYVEPVNEADPVTIYLDDVQMADDISNYRLINSAGQVDAVGPQAAVSFITPPPSGVELTWSGNFYYRCRFLNDSTDFENFMRQLWSNKKVDFKSVKP